MGVSLRALSETIDALRVAGYPPVFILMYDQAWVLCERLFEAMEVLLLLGPSPEPKPKPMPEAEPEPEPSPNANSSPSPSLSPSPSPDPSPDPTYY